jgi:(R,R)-butanediol dehydrogenase/meso-butanediol dehydrogenase/diacetyl reductase
MVAAKDFIVSGTWCYPVYDFPRVVSLVATERWPVDGVVSSVIPPVDVVQGGFNSLIKRGGGDVKALIEMNK